MSAKHIGAHHVLLAAERGLGQDRTTLPAGRDLHLHVTDAAVLDEQVSTWPHAAAPAPMGRPVSTELPNTAFMASMAYFFHFRPGLRPQLHPVYGPPG